MKSTSIHALNADRGLSWWQKPVYLFLNFLNNLFPYRHLDRRIKVVPFEPAKEKFEEEWQNTYATSSAARKFSDLYWKTLPWEDIRRELGGEINIFDTGCGHGNYAVRIQEGSGGRITSYTGVDAKRRPNWEELENKFPNFHFIESRSSDILPLIPPGTNLFITQSAIEHFDADILFFEKIKTYAESVSFPVMQAHLFPGGATLPLYLFHGLRQYTPRTVSKITRLFSRGEFTLTGLGGNASKWLHWRYFTWPVLITRKYAKPTFDAVEYEPKLRKAVIHDIKHPSRSPLFWALTIKSR
jgi:hypothetical protein